MPSMLKPNLHPPTGEFPWPRASSKKDSGAPYFDDINGVFAIYAAIRAWQRGESWGLLVLQGVASIAAAVILFLWPGITVLAFVLLIAAWAVSHSAPFEYGTITRLGGMAWRPRVPVPRRGEPS
jgi:hypothetical protein